MTQPTETGYVRYDGDGSTTVFPVPFKFLLNSHVTVTLRNKDNVETTWVENTQYTLTGAGNNQGGTLTVVTFHQPFTVHHLQQLQCRGIAGILPAAEHFMNFTHFARLVALKFGSLGSVTSAPTMASSTAWTLGRRSSCGSIDRDRATAACRGTVV